MSGTATTYPRSESSSSSIYPRSTPSRSSIDLPRAQTASKGGCWTCRLRRKKCDERREGDTCQTCKRLTIKCLGWGARRPEWMRDKKAVDEYKAGIKEQLKRAGLIRGHPRSQFPSHNPPSRAVIAAAAASPPRPPIHHQASAPKVPVAPQSSLGLPSNNSHEDLSFPPKSRAIIGEGHGFPPEMLGASNSVFMNNDMLYGVPLDHNGIGLGGMSDVYSSDLPLSPLAGDALFGLPANFSSFPSNGYLEPAPVQYAPSQQAINIDQTLFEFNNARQMLFRFDAYGVVSSITFELMKQDPAGPVTKAARALGQLGQERMRVSQGMEQDSRQELSPASYFRNEALMQIQGKRELQLRLTEADAVAAFYLTLFSQLGGRPADEVLMQTQENKELQRRLTEEGAVAAFDLTPFSQLGGHPADWDEPFGILCDWLVQTGLTSTEEPWLFFQGLSAAGRFAVKGALWIDILSSITTGRGPKFYALWRRLLGDRGTYWDQNNMSFQRGLRMDTLIGLPDEALLTMAEVSVLAQWKANAQREGTLSYRELIRRGDVIERRLRQQQTDTRLINDVNIKLIQNEILGEPDAASPGDEVRATIADLFREAAVLYLRTVLNSPCPNYGFPPEMPGASDSISFLQQCKVKASLLEEVAAGVAQKKLAVKLDKSDVQTIVNFLSKRLLLHHEDLRLSPKGRKYVLQFLCKLAKANGAFPKHLELQGIQCNLTQPVAEGGFGYIYKGRFDGQSVCVKTIRVSQYHTHYEERLRAQAGELVLWAHLSHVNILPFSGLYYTREEVPRACIVSPWMDNGDLLQFLTNHPSVLRTPLLHDIISGLGYLHEHDIVHADLKAVGTCNSGFPTKRAMLADFGVSRLSMTLTTTTTNLGRGTANWMAPELLIGDLEVDPIPKKESDIWAFGCTCYELMTGKMPFWEIRNVPQLIRAFMRGNQSPCKPTPEPGSDEFKKVWSLAEQCWQYDPTLRPTSAALLGAFAELNASDDRPRHNGSNTIKAAEVNINHAQVCEILQKIKKSMQRTGNGNHDK
ncbi:hypothetical protein NP233_g4366 [Leucocoprinus birnbaumii]|uniref:Uncharacterized protein n=1 Tax=Leucocoprinus birnbaumii TaxID=56174 RepID=A0AAD5YRX3_9AGAR|nr:hypothetical protein NP233_g4366 [Leucocoprinus birnbaumii]